MFVISTLTIIFCFIKEQRKSAVSRHTSNSRRAAATTAAATTAAADDGDPGRRHRTTRGGGLVKHNLIEVYISLWSSIWTNYLWGPILTIYKIRLEDLSITTLNPTLWNIKKFSPPLSKLIFSFGLILRNKISKSQMNLVIFILQRMFQEGFWIRLV